MKRLSVLLLGALALTFNACEKHPASRLPGEHDFEFGRYLNNHGGGAHDAAHAPAPAAKHPPAAAPAEAAKPAAEAKPGEAPKFFPEKK